MDDDNPAVLSAKGGLKQAKAKLRKAMGGDKFKAAEEELEGKFMSDMAELRINRRKRSRDAVEEESVAREEQAEAAEKGRDLDDDEW